MKKKITMADIKNEPKPSKGIAEKSGLSKSERKKFTFGNKLVAANHLMS